MLNRSQFNIHHSTLNIHHSRSPVTLAIVGSQIHMRYFFAVVLLCTPVFAQQPPPRPPNTNELFLIERYASRLQTLAQAIKRDAFIVSQVVQGSGELNDFQRNNAIQKANDRVDAAIKRGSDEKASLFTMTALSQTKDALLHAREQSSTADLPALQRTMIDKTHMIYIELFRELDTARKERQALVDVQKRLADINQDIDGAMVDALASTFEFIRAGGK